MQRHDDLARANVLRIPDPCLVVLIGAAGSGKSTLASRLFPADAILSSDAFRGVVAGNPADQRATKTAFAILHRQLARRLAARQMTVVDATNVTSFARRGLVRRAAAQAIPVVAIVLDIGVEEVLAQNAGRAARGGRVVPGIAVRGQLAELERSLLPGALDSEGFAVVRRLRSAAEMDALSVSWLSAT